MQNVNYIQLLFRSTCGVWARPLCACFPTLRSIIIRDLSLEITVFTCCTLYGIACALSVSMQSLSFFALGLVSSQTLCDYVAVHVA